MSMPSIPQLLIVLAIIVLLFGAKKIPDLAKGLGSGIKNFKKAIKDDDEVVVAKEENVKNIEGQQSTQTTQAANTAQTTNSTPKEEVKNS